MEANSPIRYRWQVRSARLLTGAILLVASAIFAYRQPLRPARLESSPFWGNLLYPIESTPVRGYGQISAKLNAITSLPGSEVVWAAGDNRVLIYSSDSGRTWTQAKQVAPALAFLETNTSSRSVIPRLFEASGGNPDDIVAVYFSDEKNGWAAERGLTMLRTRDGGQTWDFTAEQGASHPWTYASGLCFIPNGDSNSGWGWAWNRENGLPIAGTSGKLGASGFVSILAQTTVGARVSAMFFSSGGKTGWRTIQSRLEQSRDGGLVWNPIAVPQLSNVLGSDEARAIWFADDGQIGYVTTKQGSISRTKDGGATWDLSVRTGAKSALNAVYFDPEGKRGWAAGDDGVIVHTNDGGDNWAPQLQPANTTAQPVPHFPGIWFYLSCLVSLVFMAVGFRRVRVPEPTTGQETFIPDDFISRPQDDRLDFLPIVTGLSKFLRNRNTEPPVTIAVTADWGRGKTSMMRLLESDLRQKGYRPVWFNAWHHQKEESLLASLLQHLRKDVLPGWWTRENIRVRLKLLSMRGDRNRFTFLLLSALFGLCLTYLLRNPDNPIAYLSIPKSKALPAPFLAGILGLYQSISAFGVKPWEALLTLFRGAKVGQVEAQPSFRYRFAGEFSDVTEALDPARVIIFIDDLDRCSPEATLEMLEATNFLVSSGRCFIVLGMARDRVEACVAMELKEIADQLGKDYKAYAREYMDKLIQIEISVPAMNQTSATAIAQHEIAERKPENRRRMALTAASLVAMLALSLGGPWFLKGNKGAQVTTASANPTPTPSPPPTPPMPSPTPTPMPSPTPTPISGPTRSSASTPTPSPTPTPVTTLVHVSLPSPPVSPWWSVTAMVAGGIAVILLALWWIFRTSEELWLDDDATFKKISGLWAPYAAQYKNTPRALKRFLNKARYLDMSNTSVSGQISREVLIPLVAVDYMKPELLEEPRLRQKELSTETNDRAELILKNALKAHMENGLKWPPTESEIEQFDKLRAIIRMSGNGETAMSAKAGGSAG